MRRENIGYYYYYITTAALLYQRRFTTYKEKRKRNAFLLQHYKIYICTVHRKP